MNNAKGEAPQTLPQNIVPVRFLSGVLDTVANFSERTILLVEDTMSLSVAYQAFLFDTLQVTGNPNPTVNGTYRTTLHVGSLNLRVNF